MKRPIDRQGVPRYSLINPLQGHIITNPYPYTWLLSSVGICVCVCVMIQFLSILIKRDTGRTVYAMISYIVQCIA